MKVNLLNKYRDVYSTNIDEQLANNGVALRKNNLKQNQMANSNNSQEIITKSERNFFKQMFPENSNQIEKHVVFNRNGKLQDIQVSKGIIFDGKF
ncbi:MAG TPA: hypothetical protein PLU67_09595 [Candidatus Kapabacteria bacterium]|jgi:ClpP class serine protease|nr:hypothetical protein [Candidatus Kapabacteria bacterium]HPP39952.1 hypothetical protein [Candidatus Kapabacteria bacterium]HPU23169.1 hypothetical protein [Candidatus Kapabacteria bacterium]